MTKVLTPTETEYIINRFMFDDSITILSVREKPINGNQLKYTIIIEDTKPPLTKNQSKEQKEKKPKKEKVVISPNRDPIPPPRPPMAEITQL